jgi:LacI family repressor for deo operon, udp, cdd, tsx, nupC, and nupG
VSAPEKKATISDVARLAGVSTATVSRSLSSPAVVTEETRARVAEAIARTGYIANSAARTLRRRRSDAVVVAVPDLGNTFFAELISGIESVARERGVAVLVADVPRGGRAGVRLAQQLDAGRADGALLLHGALLPGADAPGRDWKLITVAEELPGDAEEGQTVSHVGIDNHAAASKATAHLIGLGHRRIVHITGPRTTILTRQRMAGYEAMMRKAGLATSIRIVPGDFSIASGHRAARSLLLAGASPDAVFCANDEMAIGVINGLAAAGLSVPGDVSVMGFDDIAFAAWSNPPLTTIRQPRREIGRLAMTELLRQIEGVSPAPPVHVPFELVERQSTRRRRASPADDEPP